MALNKLLGHYVTTAASLKQAGVNSETWLVFSSLGAR